MTTDVHELRRSDYLTTLYNWCQRAGYDENGYLAFVKIFEVARRGNLIFEAETDTDYRRDDGSNDSQVLTRPLVDSFDLPMITWLEWLDTVRTLYQQARETYQTGRSEEAEAGRFVSEVVGPVDQAKVGFDYVSLLKRSGSGSLFKPSIFDVFDLTASNSDEFVGWWTEKSNNLLVELKDYFLQRHTEKENILRRVVPNDTQTLRYLRTSQPMACRVGMLMQHMLSGSDLGWGEGLREWDWPALRELMIRRQAPFLEVSGEVGNDPQACLKVASYRLDGAMQGELLRNYPMPEDVRVRWGGPEKILTKRLEALNHAGRLWQSISLGSSTLEIVGRLVSMATYMSRDQRQSNHRFHLGLDLVRNAVIVMQ